jgi:hypothetical protein
VKTVQHKKQTTKRQYKTVVSGKISVHIPDYARGLGTLNLYAIYPDYWGENIERQASFRDVTGKTVTYKPQHDWGNPPVLGYVRESSPYWARYAAYTMGLVPFNATFKPKAILVKRENKDKKKYGTNQGSGSN